MSNVGNIYDSMVILDETHILYKVNFCTRKL